MLDQQEDGLSNISDYDGLEDEAFPPLPPPYSPEQEGGQQQGELFGDAEEGELSKLADIPAAKQKGVKRPQPKLDSQRLISERGLPALRTLFENVHFKGKGHEAEDLRLLMQKMENWSHRLFPKLQFEDFIDRVEKLGSKKEVQTCLKRIRLDMPLTHEDYQDKDGEAEVAPEFQVFEDFDPFSSESSVNVHSTPALTTPSLTEEQLRRMELNRQRALERRLARHHQTDPSDPQTVVPPSPGNEPSCVSSANVLNASADREEKLEDLDLSSPLLSLCPPSSDVEPLVDSTQCEEGRSESLEPPLSNSCEEEN